MLPQEKYIFSCIAEDNPTNPKIDGTSWKIGYQKWFTTIGKYIH